MTPPPSRKPNGKDQDVVKAIDRVSYFPPYQNDNGRQRQPLQVPIDPRIQQLTPDSSVPNVTLRTRPPPAAGYLSKMEESSQDGQMMKLLGLAPLSTNDLRMHVEQNTRTSVPDGYRDNILRRWQAGEFGRDVARYYLEILPRGDSKIVPGQGRRRRLAQAVLSNKPDYRRWSAVKALGQGGFGSVILWEKRCKDGKVDTPSFSHLIQINSI